MWSLCACVFFCLRFSSFSKTTSSRKSRSSSAGWGILTFLETFDSRFFLYFMQGVAFGLGRHGAKLFYELIWQKYVTGGRYVPRVTNFFENNISIRDFTHTEKVLVINENKKSL